MLRDTVGEHVLRREPSNVLFAVDCEHELLRLQPTGLLREGHLPVNAYRSA